MYKVFFNASSISLCSKNEILLKHNNIQATEIKEHTHLLQLITGLEQNKNRENIVISGDNIAELWKNFKKEFIQIKAAGGIVTDSHNRILVIKRLGYWDLPKGKIEKRETKKEAAIREVEEECGISGIEAKKEIGSVFHIYRSPFHPEPNNLVLKETTWFEMFYPGNGTPQPQTSESIEEVRWMKINELDDFFSSTYPNLIELVEKYLNSSSI